jgi:hypothetical protein
MKSTKPPPPPAGFRDDELAASAWETAQACVDLVGEVREVIEDVHRVEASVRVLGDEHGKRFAVIESGIGGLHSKLDALAGDLANVLTGLGAMRTRVNAALEADAKQHAAIDARLDDVEGGIGGLTGEVSALAKRLAVHLGDGANGSAR